jgi:hypothetical protein
MTCSCCEASVHDWKASNWVEEALRQRGACEECGREVAKSVLELVRQRDAMIEEGVHPTIAHHATVGTARTRYMDAAKAYEAVRRGVKTGSAAN